MVGKERLFYSGGREPGEKADSCPKANSPLPVRGPELLGTYRQMEGATCRMAQSALTVILKLVMWWSDQRHLVLSTVSLQFQGQFPFP